MRARIYQPAQSSMQSGRANTAAWVLEFPRQDRATPDQLMGWQSSSDTLRTIHMKFETKDEALAYAERVGLDVHVIKTGAHRKKLRGYADNFSSNRRQAWTH